MDAVMDPLGISRYETYGKWQARGRLLSKWMDGPDVAGLPACPFGPCTLDVDDIQFRDPPPRAGDGTFNEVITDEATTLGLWPSDPGAWETIFIASTPTLFGSRNALRAYITKGAIWVPYAMRENGPHISDLLLRAYELHHPLRTLNHIIIVTIINQPTIAFYKSILNVWPDPRPNPRDVWERGSAEFNAWLGLPFGTMVSNFIFGAFRRGTARVSRIHTWAAPVVALQMRFDIEHTHAQDVRALLAEAKAADDFLDTSDLSDVQEFSSSSGIGSVSPPPSDIDDYLPSGEKMTVSEGKRRAGSPPGGPPPAKKAKEE
nr:hypothetical protein [Penicillium meliponae]